MYTAEHTLKTSFRVLTGFLDLPLCLQTHRVYNSCQLTPLCEWLIRRILTPVELVRNKIQQSHQRDSFGLITDGHHDVVVELVVQ